MDTKIIKQWKEYIQNKLLPLIKESGSSIEGNIYSPHKQLLEKNNLLEQKQQNFLNIISNNTDKTDVLEIGFNAGYSSLLMLMCNPNIKLTAIDINIHKYTEACFNQIKKDFHNIRLITESSLLALPKLIQANNAYDIIHIDGDHNARAATLDIQNSIKLSKIGSLLIVDDTNMAHINQICNNLVSNKIAEDLQIKNGEKYQHRFMKII
jgi:predicted O-methyltransferase YrrM